MVYNACSCQISPHIFSKPFYINELRGIMPTKTRPPIHLQAVLVHIIFVL